jgi:hypothetical protein
MVKTLRLLADGSAASDAKEQSDRWRGAKSTLAAMLRAARAGVA